MYIFRYLPPWSVCIEIILVSSISLARNMSVLINLHIFISEG